MTRNSMIAKNQNELFNDVSAKALGLFLYIICSDSNISAANISKTLKEGETAIATGLQELRSLGWLKLKTLRSKEGTFMKSTSVTNEGYQFISKALAQIEPFNSHFLNLFYDSNNTHASDIGKFIPRPSGETYSVIDASGYNGLSNEELWIKALETEKEKQEAMNKIKIEREEWQAKEHNKRKAQFKARSLKPDKRTWTPTDISFEFGDRVNEIWKIPPWRVTQTRFRMILADMRRRHDTNGLIECAMIDAFFERRENLALQDGDHIMMRFFYLFRSLLKTVRERELGLTEEEKAAKEAIARENRRRSVQKLFDVEIKTEEELLREENGNQFRYHEHQLKLNFEVELISAEELKLALAELDLKFQPR